MLDSIGLVNLITNSNITSTSDFYFFISSTFNIPINVVQGFSIYSVKILPQLERESEKNHPIPTRYYNLIKNDCLTSIFPDEMFTEDELPIFLRVRCGFWELFVSCAGLAGSAAGIVTTGWSVAGAIGFAASAYGYGSAIADCL